MTVRELIEMLERQDPDAPVCYLLEQHRTNLRYDVRGLGYASDDTRDDAACVFLLGDGEEYGPRDVDEQ
jgi:hypothetical protein